jgi:hypothetical protein
MRWRSCEGLPLVTPPPAQRSFFNFLYWPYQVPQHINSHKMSGHCHEDHDHSGHGHDHAGHDHSDDITPALQYSLYQHISFDDITTRNESEPYSGKAIIKKTWAERLEAEPELESDADEQLLIHIPCVCILDPRDLDKADRSPQQLHRPSQAAFNTGSHLQLFFSPANPQNIHKSR